ncbi:MAG: AcrB/AcrD/AcrF family protein [Spirochaetae bacterium HGW-Spirochaetae-1]|jgi:multidrug efflux pump subunit AcrB|nr:MAG: AcrB/AcrD/AcrF family protein [Spirochaetae bacterium HGW-Spirochaetae-1]
MKRLVAYFAERSLLVNIFTVGLLIAGLVFIFSAKREAFPNVDFDWVLITTVYPGATPADVEKHITKPVEDELREVDGIKQIHASSLESRSVIAIQLDPDLDNKDKTINDIKNAVDKVDDMPDDAEDPDVRELNTKQQPIIEISIFSKNGVNNDAQEFELRRYAKMLEDKIVDVSGVAKVDKKGYRDREMIIDVKPGLLDSYHVAINEVILALSRKSLDFPGGVIKEDGREVLIRTVGEVKNVDEIRKVLIRANDMGNWVTIGDVAQVRDSFEEETVINKTRGEKSIALTVVKKESADIITLVDSVMVEVDKFKKILPKEYNISIYRDFSYYVKRRLNVLVTNGIIGFTLVVLSLLITLGWRISIVTALGIPTAFFATFIWMAWYGISINLMSMFGLIMVLGMLVDDAIVVAENIYRHMEEGESVKQAVVNGTSEVIIPVMGTILTTVVAFSPLILMKGIMGKFMWTLPAVVIVALLASWIECMFILPSHIKDIEKDRSNHKALKDEEGGLHVFFMNKYKAFISVILTNRYKSLFLISVFFIASIIFAVTHIKFILFPQGGVEIAVVKAEATSGTLVQDMSRKLGLVEKVVGELPAIDLDTYTASAGILQEQPNDPNTKRGSNYGIVMIYLTPEQNRKRKADEIIDEVRKKCAPFKKEFTKLEFAYIANGPPVGKPVQVTIKGDDFDVLRKISGDFKTYLHTIKGLKDIKDDFEDKKDEIRVVVDERTAAIAGITVYDVASTVRSCYEGTVATSIRKTDEVIDVRVNFPEGIKNRVASLQNIKIANRMGNLIPLSRIAHFETTQGMSLITRKDYRRVVNVTADIDEHAKGVTSVTVNRMLTKKFEGIEQRYPGYAVSYEGEFKDTQESVEDLMKSFVIAFVAIYIILVALFRSLVHPLIIVMVIPMTLIGVIWTFFFHGLPISFLALMGVVGLAGVVVNDSIVLVDFIQKKRVEGLHPVEACVEAGATRLRPIFLTTITTVLGLMPTAYGIGGYDPFLKPMALSLSYGLVFGTLITLIGTPILYVMLSDIRQLIFKEEYQEKPREELSETAKLELEKEIESKVEADLVARLKNEITHDLVDAIQRGKPSKKGKPPVKKK